MDREVSTGGALAPAGEALGVLCRASAAVRDVGDGMCEVLSWRPGSPPSFERVTGRAFDVGEGRVCELVGQPAPSLFYQPLVGHGSWGGFVAFAVPSAQDVDALRAAAVLPASAASRGIGDGGAVLVATVLYGMRPGEAGARTTLHRLHGGRGWWLQERWSFTEQVAPIRSTFAASQAVSWVESVPPVVIESDGSVRVFSPLVRPGSLVHEYDDHRDAGLVLFDAAGAR